ncbi:hypothetical protein BKA57DRAFT_54245 [Linnemannia elongata]|nr:hypothetical protein BGZ91_005341 [Linnemannia elongata]KAH7048156.1 hypothetical protein BKA57DRAFT_54245 [Linnemannia elongata]
MTRTPSTMAPRPHIRVIIVGAGIGGLMLGILLQRMGVTYQIFERAPKVKPLGALMSINSNILPVFEQLGLLERVEAISLLIYYTTLFNGKLEKIAEVNTKDHRDRAGYDFLVFSRPELYDILLSEIPQERISFNKRVLSMTKTITGTEINCSDNSSYEADIIVGADGAYSSIRQNIYRKMSELGTLPASDGKDMAMPYLCMVGTTTPRDPERYPELKDTYTHIHHVIGDSTPFSWTVITIPGNRFCWSVMQQITDQAEAREQRFRNSEWGPEANEELIEAVHAFPVTFGGTLGEIIDATPKDRISKVMLEEKLFDTWYHENVVLIGDACHKMLPTSGQGAINAMQDAVILANCLYDLEDVQPESLTAAFKSYKQQRYCEAKKQITNSKVNAKISSGQTKVDRAIRHVVLNYIPRSMQDRQFTKDAAYRPQCTFMQRVPDKGTVPSQPQPPSKRYEAEMEVNRRYFSVPV